MRSGDRLAVALADGTAGVGRVAEIGAAVVSQLTDVAAARRGYTERRVEARHALHAAQAELGRLPGSGRPRHEVVVGVEADASGTVELELTYVVDGTSWTSAYDAQLVRLRRP